MHRLDWTGVCIHVLFTLTSLSATHSSQLRNFCFIFLIATYIFHQFCILVCVIYHDHAVASRQIAVCILPIAYYCLCEIDVPASILLLRIYIFNAYPYPPPSLYPLSLSRTTYRLLCFSIPCLRNRSKTPIPDLLDDIVSVHFLLLSVYCMAVEVVWTLGEINSRTLKMK